MKEPEDAALTVDVSQRASDQDQRGEGEEVGVRNPLLRREPTPEVTLDRRDVH